MFKAEKNTARAWLKSRMVGLMPLPVLSVATSVSVNYTRSVFVSRMQ